MTNTNIPYTRDDLLNALRWVNQEIASSYGQIPAQRFFASTGEWSPAENLVHLIKSVSPVGKAMKLPSLLPKAKAPSRRYEEIREIYLQEIARGAQAAGGFLPQVDSAPEDIEQAKSDILAKWHEVAERLVNALADWADADLDHQTMPHPLIGALTVREMLFFTRYHNLRHLNEVRAALGQSSIPA